MPNDMWFVPIKDCVHVRYRIVSDRNGNRHYECVRCHKHRKMGIKAISSYERGFEIENLWRKC